MVGARVGQVGTLGFSPMGRANSKPRKKKGHHAVDHNHLAKVGSKPELAHDGKRERAAVMDVMGMGGASGGAKRAFFVIGVLILVAAIVALVVLNTL
jgi:hypothetical protein